LRPICAGEFSIAKPHSGPTDHFFELVSDGNMSFDPAAEEIQLRTAVKQVHARMPFGHQ